MPRAINSEPSPWQARELTRLRTLTQGKSAGTLAAAEAAWTLGLLSLHGIAMPINPGQAQEWFGMAAQSGLVLAHAGLAWCALENCSALSDPATAQKSIALLKTVNTPRALYLEWLALSRLAPIQLQPALNGNPKSQPEPQNPNAPLPHKSILLEAAKRGDAQARIELGIDSAANNRLAESLSYFESAAAQSAVAKTNASIMAARMRTLSQQNHPSGLDRSASNSSALLAQARRLHKGEGVPSNFTEAIRLYRLSADLGNKQAEKMLRLIYSNLTPDGQINLAWMQQLKDVDLSTPAPQQESTASPYRLEREPTALYDLLPAKWR